MKNILVILCFVVLSESINAQEYSVNLSPGGVFEQIFDRYGKIRTLEELMVDTRTIDSISGNPKTIQICSPGYFDLYFETGSGMEGNSPVEIARRNVLCQVFSDLSQFIVPVNPNTKVNILIRNINKELSGYDPVNNPFPAATVGVGGLATDYYIVPSSAPNFKGIIDGQIWKTINSGVDAYSGIASPLHELNQTGATYYHGMVAVNFWNPLINWHTDLSQNTSTGLIDLYTVLLHEVTHALDFASLINSSGDSQFGPPNHYYARYDLFLKTTANVPLITNTGACSLYEYGFNSSLSSSVLAPSTSNCPDHIQFGGSVNQSVYTPPVYANESSLSHLEDVCHVPTSYPDDTYYVMSNNGIPGSVGMKRYLKPEERSVLCDLGYQVNTTYGNASNLNYYNYGGSTCLGLQIAGVNDGITSGGFYQYVVNENDPITISDILNNDYNAVSFECLEDIYGNGTLSNTSGTSFTYNTTTSGIGLLRYIPVSASGNRGNITYVIVYISEDNCTPEACTMLNNSGFENTNGCGEIGSSTPVVATACWIPCTNTPDLFQRNCTNAANGLEVLYSVPAVFHSNPPYTESWSNAPNDHFIGMASTSTSSKESVQSLLNTPLIPNHSYTISFRARLSDRYYNIPMLPGTTGQITFGAAPTILGTVPGPFATLPSSVTPLGNPITIIGDHNWNLYSQTFTYNGTGNLSNFVLMNTSVVSAGTQGRYLFVDDITLIEVNPALVLTLPDTICPSGIITDLSIFAPVPNGTFAGNGVQNSGGIFSFDASVAGAGTHIITYTHVNSNGCSVIISDTVTVANFTVSVSPEASTICNGSSVNLTASGANTYTWSPATGLSATTGASVSAGPSSSTTYTVIGTETATGCTATKTILVTVVPYPVITFSPSNPSICTGQQVALTASGAIHYTWSPPTGLSPTSGATVVASPGNTTTYSVIGSTAGCSNTQTITVTVNPQPVVTVAPANSTICAGQQVVLTASGANTYTWSPATGLSATTGASVTATPGSTITYTVTVSSSGCTATQTASITVNPCTDCGTGTLIAGNVGSSPAANTTLRIPNNITITGNVNFIGNNVKIHPGVTITVASTATLNITGAHFYGCENMWNGIQVQPGGKVNIQPYIVGGTVQKTTLIEDAEVAIDFLPITAQQASAFLQVNNATFNRNTTSIRVQSYAFANVGSMIVVKNSLFTCRNIYNTANSTWPLTTVVKTANGNTNPYLEPYIAYSYGLVNLKAPQNTTFSDKGIQFGTMGTTSGATYNSVTIGSTVTAEYNVFDNLKTALHCTNANVKLINSTVQFPQIITSAMYTSQSLPNVGTGIFATADALFLCKVDIAGSKTQANRFYGLSRALHVVDYNNIQFNYNTVRSNRNNNYMMQGYYNGDMGVYAQLKLFKEVNITRNTIYNIDKGTSVFVNTPNNGASIGIAYNTFQKNLGTNAGAFATDAIQVSNSNTANVFGGSITALNNIITGSLRGITLNNWTKTLIWVKQNEINLGINPNLFMGATSYGIALNNCMGGGSPNLIHENNVFGFSHGHENYKGIQLTQAIGNELSCNGVRNTHSGLYFNGNNYPTLTYKNSMENHRYGFVLDNSAVIGQQGSPSTPADNVWSGTNWHPTVIGNYKNVCLSNSLAEFSKMYVRNSSNYSPIGSTFNISGGVAYTTTGTPVTLFYVSNPPIVGSCVTGLPPEEGLMAGESETESLSESVSFLESAAALVETVTEPDHHVVMKNQLYRLTEAESSVLSANHSALDAFISEEATSNIGSLWEVEKALVAGDDSLAASINSAFVPENLLETSYQQLYDADLHFRNGLFNPSDSMTLVTLAEGCPAQQGASVFQAQALYNQVYSTSIVFTTNCATYSAKTSQQSDIQERSNMIENRDYRLYPVPNNGNFQLRGSLNMQDQVLILQVDGKVLFEEIIKEPSNMIALETALSSGTYVLVLKNKEGQMVYRNRVVVIK